MSDERICGACGLPIHGGESGLRHHGWFTCHSESRCVELLKAKIDLLLAELDAAKAELDLRRDLARAEVQRLREDVGRKTNDRF